MYQASINGQTLFYDCAANAWVLVTIPKGTGVGSVSGRSSGYMLDTRRNLIWDSETNCETFVLKLTPALFSAVEKAGRAAKACLNARPNPFNPAVRITTGLPAGKIRQITIFDVTGRRVAVSTRDFTWNAAGFPAGVYAVRLEAAGGQTLTRSIVLVK
jgi:hypothetical protein